MQLIQIQMMTAWFAARERLADSLTRVRDDRGELTGSVILLAALAVAAAAVGVIIVARINAAASRVP
jgi:hypothetical protein